jgi:uncharacterized protein YndB with AHSA1/START domain
MKKRISIERTYRASVEDVWDLWTTEQGIESWWGPEGFTVKVQRIDLRPGGELFYTMTAIAPQQVEFMKKAGMPLTTEARLRYTEVLPQRRIAYLHKVDFVPGVEPYDVAHLIELHPSAEGVRLVLTIDAMHDEEWTKRAVAGWQEELGKLGRVLEAPGTRQAER